MKKNLFFSLLAASALLASCSSDDVVEGNGLLADGEGYVRLAINLPSVSGNSTRGGNDDFDDGTANEYAVNDATLILFQGTSEDVAEISTAYDLNLTFNLEGTTTDNITSTAQIVQKINATLGSSDKLYALVVLNKNAQLVVTATNTLSVNGVDVTGKTLAWFIENTKIDVSAHTLVTYTSTGAEQFFMANAPLNTVAGGSSDPTGTVKTLAEIDPAKIYPSETEAASNPATEVSVERAVAKVTLSDAVTGEHKTSTNNLEYTILGWQLDNTNTESYLVRNVDGFTTNWAALMSNKSGLANPYRFVGSSAVTTGLFRTYWGIDPNYDTTDGTGMKYWDEDDTDAPDYVAADGAAHPLYCAENTFDVEHQKDINTTAAIVKVKFNNGKLFYTINNNSAKFYLGSTDAEANGTNGIKKAIKAAFMSNTNITSALTAADELNATLTEDKLTVTFTDELTPVAGITKVADIVIDKSVVKAGYDIHANAYIITGTTTALDLVNASNTIRRYVDGISYYAVQIKHFGDELTPWNNGETDAPSAGTIYPAANANANYLGRYGVLRNNWYDISVTAIKNLGAATVPTLGTTPTTPPDDPDIPGDGGHDDDLDQYISVKINILSWAKRTQSITL